MTESVYICLQIFVSDSLLVLALTQGGGLTSHALFIFNEENYKLFQ